MRDQIYEFSFGNDFLEVPFLAQSTCSQSSSRVQPCSGRNQAIFEEQCCGKMPSRKPRVEFRKWIILSAISAVWILHQMFAHEILRNSAQSIVEKSILVCIRFSKCGYVIFGSETIFLGTIIARTFTFYQKTRGAKVPGLTRTGMYTVYI